MGLVIARISVFDPHFPGISAEMCRQQVDVIDGQHFAGVHLRDAVMYQRTHGIGSLVPRHCQNIVVYFLL